VTTGIDKNHDGTLESNEVTSTQEICNGTTGSSTLVIVDNMVGTNCPNGGQRIQTGKDTNGNGMLDASEVTNTQYVCNGVVPSTTHFGSVSISSAADVTAAQDYAVIVGALTIEPTFSGMMSLHNLQVVTGPLDAEGDNANSVDLDMPALASAEYIEIEGVAGLTALTFDALTSASAIEVDDMPDLATISVAKLTSTAMDIEDNSALTSVSAPLVATGTEMLVRSNQLLTSVSFPALTTSTSIDIESNPALTSISLPLLAQSDEVYIYNNAALTTVTAPVLTKVSSFDIFDNATLSQCGVLDILGPIIGHNPSFDSFNYSGNSTAATCTYADWCSATFKVTGITGTFALCLSQLDQADAETQCQAFGGHLATFATDAEWQTFQTYMQSTFAGNGFDGWMGYDDLAVAGTWVGVVTAGYNPATTDTTFWDVGQPDDSGGVEHCSELFTDGFANDNNCTATLQSICRK
jgi:hypothetical protein